MKIKELKEKYEGEWLAIKVTKEKNGKAVEGELKEHCSDRKEIWEKAKKMQMVMQEMLKQPAMICRMRVQSRD